MTQKSQSNWLSSISQIRPFFVEYFEGQVKASSGAVWEIKLEISAHDMFFPFSELLDAAMALSKSPTTAWILGGSQWSTESSSSTSGWCDRDHPRGLRGWWWKLCKKTENLEEGRERSWRSAWSSWYLGWLRWWAMAGYKRPGLGEACVIIS